MRGTTAAWGGLGVGVGVAGLVVALFDRVTTPALEIKRYARDIDESIAAIGRNLDGASELATTHELATAVPALAGAYLEKLGAGGGA